jgi:hypothetical protein
MAGKEEAPLVEENCHGRKVVAPAISTSVHRNRGTSTSGEILAAIQIEGKRVKRLCFVRRRSRVAAGTRGPLRLLRARFLGDRAVECALLILVERTVRALHQVAQQQRSDRDANQP